MFALCVEASHVRGMGHLFRALALARALEARGARSMIYVNSDEAAARVLNQSGPRWATVPLQDANCGWETQRIRDDQVRVWVNDRFETSSQHARTVKAAGIPLVTFDDRGPGAVLADLHVAPLALEGAKPPRGRKVLCGLQYLVLDPEIPRLRRLRHRLGSMIVSMGGSDTYGLTVDVVRALKERNLSATVIRGPGFAHDEALASVSGPPFVLKRDIRSLVAEFAEHDLAITAGGITPFEANALGLPCIVIAAEPWEVRAARALAKLGGCRYAGARRRIDYSVLDERLPLEQMSAAALKAVPCDGADRVAGELLSL